MFDVAVCGFLPATLSFPTADPSGSSAVIVLPDPSAEGFTERAFAALGERDQEHVLVVHAAHPAATRRIRTVRALLQVHGVVPVPVRRPLTGLAAHASWLVGLAAREVSPGLVLAALEQVERHLPTYAVTSSVAGLALPEVRMHHHVLSWVPGTTFGVELGDRPRIGMGEPGPAPAPPAGSSVPGADLLWSGDARLESRLRATLPATVHESHELTPAEGSTSWWGKARHYEHTIVPRDLDGFVETLSRATTGSCPQCGQAANGHCPFCNSQEGVAA